MTGSDWIVVPHWRTFQHYTDRDPPWIKLYTELGSNADFVDLTASSRGVLLTIWISFARSRGQLRLDHLLDQIPNKGLTKSVEALRNAGFIALVASKPLALAHSREKEEKENKKGAAKEPERRTPVDVARVNPDKVCPDCGETLGAGHLETCPRMPQLVAQ